MPRVLPMFRFARLLAVLVLVACALMAISGRGAAAEEGLASWYGPGFEGKPTASGEIFDPNAYTAAHNTLPFGTDLLVSYGGRSVPVTVNDRGPYADGRELDLSWRAANDIGLIPVGVAWVDYDVIPEGGYAADAPAAPLAAPTPTDPTPTDPPTPPTPTGGSGVYDGAYYTVQPGDASNGSPISTSDDGTYYTVQPGDTLTEIAAERGTTPDYLADQNGITNPDLIYSGQALSVPEFGPEPSGSGPLPMAGDGSLVPAPTYNAGTAVDPLSSQGGPQPAYGGTVLAPSVAPNGP